MYCPFRESQESLNIKGSKNPDGKDICCMLSKIFQNLFNKEIHFYLPSIIPINDPLNASQ